MLSTSNDCQGPCRCGVHGDQYACAPLVLDCEVLAIEPNRTLCYTWNFAHDDAAFNLKSVVTFTLTPTRTGTHLRMEQSGFRPDQKQAYGGAKAGWQQFFAKLDQVLAQTD